MPGGEVVHEHAVVAGFLEHVAFVVDARVVHVEGARRLITTGSAPTRARAGREDAPQLLSSVVVSRITRRVPRERILRSDRRRAGSPP
jgi:transposase